MSDADYDELYDCHYTAYEDPECKPVFLRSACYAILDLYQEHNEYLKNPSEWESTEADNDFSWADGTSTGGDAADDFEVELDELE